MANKKATVSKPRGAKQGGAAPAAIDRQAELFELVRIRADLAKLVGRLAVSGRRGGDPLAAQLGLRDDGPRDEELRTRAAQVIDAVNACLARGEGAALLGALSHAEASLRHALEMRVPRVHAPGARGYPGIFEEVCSDVAARLREEPDVSNGDLALQVDAARVMRSGGELLGKGKSDDARLATWKRLIGLVRDRQRRWEPEDLARAVVQELAAKNGVPRPSALARRPARRKDK